MNTQEQNHPQVLERVGTRAGQQIRETASQLGETAARATEGLEQGLNTIGTKFNGVRDSVVDKTKGYMKTTDDYVSKNPWVAVGISAGVAFIAGMLFGRKRNE